MPYKITKVDGYRVSTPHGVHAKNTTKKKAQAQVRLMQGVEHGWKPTGRKARRGAGTALMQGRSAKR
ncbi:MAG TPA: hypothetical protein VMY35_14390 [Phycisphaerae bacterium]|nr:hypothetical protein [Phycisphaerae bacterium]